MPGELSPRHKVRNNLLGGPGFCPILRRSPALESWLGQGLSQEARACQGQVGQALLTRAARFLLLADSQASFAIEGERPPPSTAWSGGAGRWRQRGGGP